MHFVKTKMPYVLTKKNFGSHYMSIPKNKSLLVQGDAIPMLLRFDIKLTSLCNIDL